MCKYDVISNCRPENRKYITIVEPEIFTRVIDAMLARVGLGLAMALCLSVTSRCSIQSGGRIELVVCMDAVFGYSYRKHRYLQK